MFKFDLQLFAHKKGVGSTTALSARQAISSFANAVRTSIPARMSVSAKMIHYLQKLQARLHMNVPAVIIAR